MTTIEWDVTEYIVDYIVTYNMIFNLFYTVHRESW